MQLKDLQPGDVITAEQTYTVRAAVDSDGDVSVTRHNGSADYLFGNAETAGALKITGVIRNFSVGDTVLMDQSPVPHTVIGVAGDDVWLERRLGGGLSRFTIPRHRLALVR